ncbi:MAG TPA: efflux RND transporter periplasmic adaptor subunit [Patescibacteria group bacterium]|nr:efflux RND transporter periplasmic adaptor subunit [Patescibacteria group bacterium]
MNENKKSPKKKLIIIIASVIIIAIFGYGAYGALQKQKNNNLEDTNQNNSEQERLFEVKTMTINNATSSSNNLYIETVGAVNAETKVDVTVLAKGTIQSLSFDRGDQINAGQVLAYLKSNTTRTGYQNAQTNYYNMLSNLEAVKRTTQSNVEQAEIGVIQAQEAINNAEISLKSAQENYESTISLQEKNLVDTKNSAVISYSNYLQTVKDALEDVNYIIGAEPGPRLEEIKATLSAKSYSALVKVKNTYKNTKSTYNNLKDEPVESQNIEERLEKIIDLLRETKTLTNETIIVLDNTVSSSNFPQSALNAEQEKFSRLYNTVNSSLQSAENTLNNLSTIELSQEKERIALKNNIQGTQNQLNNAEISYNNALVSLNSARESKKQQILSAQSQVDSALGQLNLSQEQLADLIISAPISGQITSKNVEVGAELNPGQVIASISQTNNVKVVINLPSEDIYQINLGQEVIINQDIKAKITNIAPSANEQTKKVEVEILVDNKNKKLIPGTFVDVMIKKNNKNSVKSGVIMIPLEALTITQTENYVYLVKLNENNELTAKKQIVTLGDSQGNLVEIKSGLKIGNEIIIDGSKSIENNSLIQIK